MTIRPKLLITGTMSRPDIVQMFDRLEGMADLTFIEYEREWGHGSDPSVYEGKGRLVTWEESKSADAVIRSVAPDRVILLFTSSLNQVALRAAARDRGVEAVHVEHGYRLPAEDAPPIRISAQHAQAQRLASGQTRLFFGRSLPRRGIRGATALGRYAMATARHGATPQVLREFADLRRPDRYISYSSECFRYHRDVDRVPNHVARTTAFTGVPQFDDFRITDADPRRGDVLLIDHQFHNMGLFGWTDAFRREWVEAVSGAIFAAGAERLHVRLHPGDRSSAWDRFVGNGHVQLIGRDELPALALTVPVVLGTFSTMQLPFAALNHVMMVSLEIHPEPGWFPSRRIVESGVAAPVRDYQELTRAIATSDELRARQRPAKPAFLKRFLERLDGHAGDRMSAALLAGEAP